MISAILAGNVPPTRKKIDIAVNAGINLTGYHPPPPPTTPGLLHNRKCPGAGPIKDDVPGAGHLHQLAFKNENC